MSGYPIVRVIGIGLLTIYGICTLLKSVLDRSSAPTYEYPDHTTTGDTKKQRT
jgi:hypothetical protein